MTVRETEQEITKTGRPSQRIRSVAAVGAPVLEPTELEQLGALLAEVVKLNKRLDSYGLELGTMASELRGLRREVELDRTALVVGSSKHAAVKASNRMALLLGTLITLVEVSAPTLREIWRAVAPFILGGQ